jgi:hypothetical protein
MNKWVDYYSEKFAELIVQECKDIAFRRGDNVDYLSLQLINNEVDDARDAMDDARDAMDAAWEIGKGCRTTKCDEWQSIKDTRKVWIAAAKLLEEQKEKNT